MAAPKGMLNIAALDPGSRALLPGGLWAGCWLQGCRLLCEGCANREYQSTRRIGMLARPESLVRWVRGLRGIMGLCLSGGEPFLQAPRLLDAVREIRKSLFVGSYSGYSLAELSRDIVPGATALAAELDILIDGPFKKELSIPGPFRGSANQTIHYLSDRFRRHVQGSTAAPNCHIRLTPDGAVVTGIGAGRIAQAIEQALAADNPSQIAVEAVGGDDQSSIHREARRGCAQERGT